MADIDYYNPLHPMIPRIKESAGKYCWYCEKDTHDDDECWSTRPMNWMPPKWAAGKEKPSPWIWTPPKFW